MKIMICFSIIIIFLNCDKKSNLENQITITINSIDKATKHRRNNIFDKVIIRKEGGGFLKKNFKIIGEYVTDSSGLVKVKIDPTKICDISVLGLNAAGGDMYYPGHLKDGQEVNIEVISYKND